MKRLLRHVGEAPLRIPFPVRRLQGLEGLGSIALHGEQVVGAVRAHDRIRGVAGCVQRVHGDDRAADFDVFQHGEHRSRLPAFVMAHPAGDRDAVLKGHQCRGLVVHLAAAVHAVDPLAVRGQRRAVRNGMSLRPAIGCGPHFVAVGVHQHPVDRGSRRRDEEAEAPSRRYVVCRNPAQARKDAATREAILKKLHTKLEKGGPKGLVGNRGFKRYLRAKGGVFEVDYDKIQSEERFDGLWVLHTNTDFEPGQIAARYKALWMVEQVFRTSKALLETRPIFHKCDETIRGHVFCSFLALVLQSELQRRMQAAGIEAEWADIRRDLNALTETEIEQDGKRFLVRSATQGSIVAIFRCAGARLPQTIRQIETAEHGETLPATE